MKFVQYQITFICFVSLLILALTCMYLYVDTWFEIKGTRVKSLVGYRRPDKPAHLSGVMPNGLQFTNYSHTLDERIFHLRDVCKDGELFNKPFYQGKPETITYYSKLYNFSFCKVPKSGSTFWTQAFLMLHDLAKDGVLNFTRGRVHAMAGELKIPLASSKGSYYRSRSILVSRDPYSRLYSAFIDKLYVMGQTTLKGMLVKSKVTCAFDIPFEKFLRFILDRAKSNRKLDRHWAPIFSLCKPCQVNLFRLVKQESFSKDVEFVLNELKIDPQKYKTLKESLRGQQKELMIRSIIESAYTQTLRKPNCADLSKLAKRLWISFQIQGYIDARISFPAYKFVKQRDFKNRMLLTESVLQALKEHPLTSQESKIQRHRSLVAAYRSVGAATIDDIKAIYKPDFALFGYDTNPPTMDSISSFMSGP